MPAAIGAARVARQVFADAKDCCLDEEEEIGFLGIGAMKGGSSG